MSLQILLAHGVARFVTWVPFASCSSTDCISARSFPRRWAGVEALGMMRVMRGHTSTLTGALVLLACAALSNCTKAAAQAGPLASTAGTVVARGELTPLRLDQVAGVSLKEGRLMARGAFETVAIDLPGFVDTAQVIRHWALVTESSLNDKKVLNFTHDQSLDDFTIELPATDAEIRYGVFAHRDGGEVMVLTWGKDAVCYWAYLVIGPRQGGERGR